MITLPFALLLAAADTLPVPAPDPLMLPVANVTVDEKAKEIMIDLPGIPLEAHTGHHGGGGGSRPSSGSCSPSTRRSTASGSRSATRRGTGFPTASCITST